MPLLASCCGAGQHGDSCLATVVLTAGLLQQVDYMTALLFQANAGIPGASGFDALEPVIATLYLIGAVVLLASVRGDRT